MESATESSLISKLQTSDIENIHQLFSDYLHAFTDLTTSKTKKPKKPSKNADEDHRSALRSLAKKFLPFINRALSIIPKRLSETPKLDEQLGLELFKTYKLCLNCLDCVASQLSCKAYSVHIQRVRLIHCFEAWGHYKDAKDEGFSVLGSLMGIGIGVSDSKKAKPKGQIVPDFEGDSVDSEFALLVVEIVVTLVKCASMNQTKDEGDYWRVLTLVDEVSQWFRVLDANAYEKLHRVLVTYLSKCTLFLVGELTYFDGVLVNKFCLATFSEYARSSLKDQMQKFARRICSSLFSQCENRPSFVIDIIICVLDSMASECKVEVESTIIEFLELVCYSANKCRTATTNLCSAIATHLNKIAVDVFQGLSPFDLILGLYATGLFLSDFNGQLRQGDSTMPRNMKDGSVIGFLLANEDKLQRLTALLGLLKCHFDINIYSRVESNYEAFIACRQKNLKSYLLPYYNALKFLCQPLAEFVNSGRKEIVAEIEGASFSKELSDIQDAFHQFCDIFLFCHSALERERDAYDDNNKTVLSVGVAAFTLSFRTKLYVKESVNFIKRVISSDWIQTQELKYLFASLHNTGIILYRNKEMKQDKSDGFHGDVSEDAIVDFVTEACAKSAFLLDVLYQCGSCKLNRIIRDILENWSVAENLFKRLPSPMALVKQWVKIECKLRNEEDLEHGSTTLYSLLSSSAKVSKRTLGIILEQELLAYKEMNAMNPRLCQRMQMNIIVILLEEVYVTKDGCLHKSRILIAKARELRAQGVEGLNGCIQCLSEAISLMLLKQNDLYGESSSCSIPVCHQLAVAYCLRALCSQETEPNSKLLLQDIQAALNLWLSPDCFHANDQCDMMAENMLILLYHVVDLLSIKGYTKLHTDIYELMIRLFKWKNVPLEKCLAMLWEYRRLCHALCASPVNEAFLVTLSQHCGELSKSIDFWISCMKRGWPLQVGFQQNFSSMFTISSRGSYGCENSFRSDITVDEVKQAASGLISSVPISSGSIFLAAYLYYDLCGRLISNGRLIEAFLYAKEAHRLRSKLLQEKFKYSVEQQSEVCDENGDTIQKCRYNLSAFQMYSSVATAVWSSDNISCDLEGCILTPWNVLQCYLESTLQVGVIHEIIGNGSEAETLLLWGKKISCFKGLPLFIVAFSSVLGRLYRKQRLWDMAEKEVQSAKQILADSCTDISCLKCRLLLEVTIDQQLGDLSRSHFDSDSGNSSLEKLFHAENLYKSALDKLNNSEWKNSVSNREEISSESTTVCDTLIKEVEYGASDSSARATNQSVIGEFPSKCDAGPETKMVAKKSKRTKKASQTLPQGQCLKAEHNLRITRSRYRSSLKSSENVPGEVQIGLTDYSNSENAVGCPDAARQRGQPSEIKCSVADSGCELTCICNKMKCWFCLPNEVIKSGSVNNFINMKWEFVRRQLSLRLLTSIGKCLAVRGEIHEAHKILVQSILVLVSRNSVFPAYSSVPLTFLLDLIGKDIPGDALAVEHAAILYSICWFTLKSYPCRSTRSNCCDLSNIQIQRIVSWLMLAFTLCREVPALFQKVSRLLAALYTLSASNESFSLPPCKTLSASHWASYFHQASLGTHINYQLFSSIVGRQKAQNPMDVEGSCLTGSTFIGSETINLLRVAPESLQDLEGFVLNFFRGLPCTTIVCVSLLGGAYASLLRELLLYPSSIHAWILISRLNSNSQPVVILLPVNSILEETSDDDANSGSVNLFEGKNFSKQWRCPWGSTVVDDVAPEFRLILEENYLSSSIFPLEDTKKNRLLWWMQRKSLDQRLGKFLRDLEDLWLGPWKYLLLGEWSDSKLLDLVQKKLVHDMKNKCEVDVQENLLKVILGGAKSVCEREEFVMKLILNKGCYIGRVGYCDQESCGSSSSMDHEVESLSHLAFKLILEAAHEIEEEECLNREPIILVLDFEVQMLPWENLPVLRNQEAYRMPSVGSISVALDRCHRNQEQAGRDAVAFPLIDPLDAFYLLNPSGDLSSTQVEFENWFRDQKMEVLSWF
ncbi:hypothetical protein F0562_020325 [Nyssa sinensis]|uniref:separase n=1 Tax=Nyssa sinensis TaxID=561372 RepID=A0A5J5BW65_9ASTE|nr:hypothetical protein F0562_020325 [Nyssa sinensis]